MPGGTPRKIIDLLKAVPLFSQCTQKELRLIANLGTMMEVKDGETLTVEGAVGREFFLLIDGEAACTIKGRRVATFGPGDFFGEMALLDRGPRQATVNTEAPSRLLVLNGREFSRLLDASPSIARSMLSVLARRERENASVHT